MGNNIHDSTATSSRPKAVEEDIKAYLSDKKVHIYKGKEYYKVKDYKQSFYVSREIVESLSDTVREVELERSGYMEKRKQKGFIKWDKISKRILVSLSNVRIYYKPFEIEKA